MARTRSPSIALLAACLASALALGACRYRPARLADAAPVTRVGDDAPIPVPRRRELYEPTYLVDIYLRRPLLDALDPRRFPDAGDVNAFDEVPRSSWFVPRDVGHAATAVGPADEGPPAAPLTIDERFARGRVSPLHVLDARGLAFELRVDPPDRPEMRTAAAAIASRLVWAFGLRTPGVSITRLQRADFVTAAGEPYPEGGAVDVDGFLTSGAPPSGGAWRVAATRWPPGIDLGSAPFGGVRGDDPNDRVAHRDRRTQRALAVLGAWLQLSDLGPDKTLDVYVGKPGSGHVEHHLTGLEDALGADDIVHAATPGSLAWDRGADPVTNLFSLGLSPRRLPTPTELRWASVGAFEPEPPMLAPTSVPFEPFFRVLPADGYWAVKRIAAISADALAAAVAAGELSDPGAARYVLQTLEARRAALVDHWMTQVTPLELEKLDARGLVVRDEAVVRLRASVASTRYLVRFLDDGGADVASPQLLVPPAERFSIAIPAEALRDAGEYLVVRVTAERDGKLLPRSFEVHLVGGAAAPRVVGVRR